MSETSDGPVVVRDEAGRDAAAVAAALRNDGLDPSTWSNHAGVQYGHHQHEFHKRLVCVQGSIVFHTPAGDLRLRSGDRLELPAGTSHRATVGADGVTCVEAAVH